MGNTYAKIRWAISIVVGCFHNFAKRQVLRGAVAGELVVLANFFVHVLKLTIWLGKSYNQEENSKPKEHF